MTPRIEAEAESEIDTGLNNPTKVTKREALSRSRVCSEKVK
jgi:hypothetical protein